MKKISLNGTWTVKKSGSREKYPANVPGDIYGDLLRNKAIDDPYFRDNELDLQWIGETDWIYSRAFNVPKTMSGQDRVLLHCDGLDTLASISINGRKIAQTDNMFRTYEFDIKNWLKQGQNTNLINITFSSASKYVREKRQERKLPQWGQPEGISGGNYIRKEPVSYTHLRAHET